MRRLRSPLPTCVERSSSSPAAATGRGPGRAPPLTCAEASAEVLAVGEHRILDPNQDDACVRLPPAGPAGAEHLYVPVATEGRETDDGVSGPIRSPAGPASQPLAAAEISRRYPPSSHRCRPSVSSPCCAAGNGRFPGPGARRSSTRDGPHAPPQSRRCWASSAASRSAPRLTCDDVRDHHRHGPGRGPAGGHLRRRRGARRRLHRSQSSTTSATFSTISSIPSIPRRSVGSPTSTGTASSSCC